MLPEVPSSFSWDLSDRIVIDLDPPAGTVTSKSNFGILGGGGDGKGNWAILKLSGTQVEILWGGITGPVKNLMPKICVNKIQSIKIKIAKQLIIRNAYYGSYYYMFCIPNTDSGFLAEESLVGSVSASI